MDSVENIYVFVGTVRGRCRDRLLVRAGGTGLLAWSAWRGSRIRAAGDFVTTRTCVLEKGKPHEQPSALRLCTAGLRRQRVHRLAIFSLRHALRGLPGRPSSILMCENTCHALRGLPGTPSSILMCENTMSAQLVQRLHRRLRTAVDGENFASKVFKTERASRSITGTCCMQAFAPAPMQC